MARLKFETGKIYHIYNRGTDGRKTFIEDKNCIYFLDYLDISRLLMDDESGLFVESVEVLAYALMPNHFHLLIRQTADGGISRFMQRLLTSYTKYFNIKYERSGVLFQGKFKAKLVDSDSYLQTLIPYIHLNPLDLYQYKWKNIGLKNKEKALSFLEKYPWSSYRDYLGHKTRYTKLLNFESTNSLLPDNYNHIIAVRELIEDDQKGGDLISHLLFD